ncbi:hypothetical protein PIB30_029804 [Stylosanthes scabra]|uniref:GRF-type domain-containing protein n=1 Tax=Stylosanthes scabra TaxID=79078 RepID=A0ABU6TB74_9FABA|nr:hypothetical protein [Stylosanthes scabra]
MASQSSTSSRRSSMRRGSSMCYCGDPPLLTCSRTKENPERRFWGCSHYDTGKGCRFFTWVDEEPSSQEDEVARLRMKISNLKAKLAYANSKVLVVTLFAFLGWSMAIFVLCVSFMKET